MSKLNLIAIIAIASIILLTTEVAVIVPNLSNREFPQDNSSSGDGCQAALWLEWTWLVWVLVIAQYQWQITVATPVIAKNTKNYKNFNW